MLPGEKVVLRVAARDCPEVAGTVRRFATLAEVRIDREVVADRVLPAVVVRFVVREVVPGTARCNTRPAGGKDTKGMRRGPQS